MMNSRHSDSYSSELTRNKSTVEDVYQIKRKEILLVDFYILHFYDELK